MELDAIIRLLVPALTFGAVVAVVVIANRHFRRIQRKFHESRMADMGKRATCPDCGGSLRGDANGQPIETCPVCAEY